MRFEFARVALSGVDYESSYRALAREAYIYAMAPDTGDVVVRDGAAGGYLIVDAITMQTLGGPYLSIADAALKAWQLCAGHVWRDSVDTQGRRLGPPFLLELQPSPLGR